ncbi:MAG: hypothetical protein HC812_04580 [Leptolyngbya sp. RL_3_1]|nr:hypothetical protein [Leptolyngbya sp. RL_3_1]
MTQVISQSSFTRLKRYLDDYKPQLEKAIMAIHTLEAPYVEEEVFTQALADLHVSATVLESYSEGMVSAIDQFTNAIAVATAIPNRGSDEFKA